jgi:hypothetical protein
VRLRSTSESVSISYSCKRRNRAGLLVLGAPDQHPDERQFSRVEDRGELTNHRRVDRQKERGIGDDCVAAARDYRENTHGE